MKPWGLRSMLPSLIHSPPPRCINRSSLCPPVTERYNKSAIVVTETVLLPSVMNCCHDVSPLAPGDLEIVGRINQSCLSRSCTHVNFLHCLRYDFESNGSDYFRFSTNDSFATHCISVFLCWTVFLLQYSRFCWVAGVSYCTVSTIYTV